VTAASAARTVKCRGGRPRQVVDGAPVLPQPQTIGEEEEVEQSALRSLREGTHESNSIWLPDPTGSGPHRGVVDAWEVAGEGSACGAYYPPNPQRLAISNSGEAEPVCMAGVTEVRPARGAVNAQGFELSANSSGSPTNCVAVRSFTRNGHPDSGSKVSGVFG